MASSYICVNMDREVLKDLEDRAEGKTDSQRARYAVARFLGHTHKDALKIANKPLGRPRKQTA